MHYAGFYLGFVTFCVLAYLTPFLVALVRKRSNVVAIGALNFFLGWTLVGWVVSLVWALSNAEPQTIIVQNVMAPPNETN